MSTPWPPPPDMESIQELVADADVEGFLADGAPTDEYESEADELFAAIEHFPTAELLRERLVPLLEEIWRKGFSLDEPALASRRSKLEGLAGQIERFFGPESKPQVRGS